MQGDNQPLDDEQLERAAATGDREAISRLYDKYFHRAYDFALRIVRDSDAAADAAQDAFLRAINALTTANKKRSSFSTFLFTIARNRAIDELRRTRAHSIDADDQPYQVVDSSRFSDPEQLAKAEEQAALVWEAARSLDERQLTVLDLHFRQGLNAGELAEVLGTTTGNAYTMISRVKGALESAIGALFLARTSRFGCPELQRILLSQESALTASMNKAINRHADACAECRNRREQLVSPSSLFGALAPIAPAPHLKRHVMASVSRAPAAPPSGSTWKGALRLWKQSPSWPIILGLGVVGVSLLMGILLVGTDGEGRNNSRAALPASTQEGPDASTRPQVPIAKTTVATPRPTGSLITSEDTGTCSTAGSFAFSDVPLAPGLEFVDFNITHYSEDEGARWSKGYLTDRPSEDVFAFYLNSMPGWEREDNEPQSGAGGIWLGWRRSEGRIKAAVRFEPSSVEGKNYVEITRQDYDGVPSDEAVREAWPFDDLPPITFEYVCIRGQTTVTGDPDPGYVARTLIVSASAEEFMGYYEEAMLGWTDESFFTDDEWTLGSGGESWHRSWYKPNAYFDSVSVSVASERAEPGKARVVIHRSPP